jgi:hypothetical protein
MRRVLHSVQRRPRLVIAYFNATSVTYAAA